LPTHPTQDETLTTHYNNEGQTNKLATFGAQQQQLIDQRCKRWQVDLTKLTQHLGGHNLKQLKSQRSLLKKNKKNEDEKSLRLKHQ
jgi:hypothetical protein